MRRIRLSEITLNRIKEAATRRVADIPDRLAWKYSARGRHNRRKLTRFKDLYRGQRCFLLANGPGLVKLDLRPLANEITFGFNRVYAGTDKLGFEPTYLVTMNDTLLDQFGEDIAALKMPRFLSWRQRDLFEERSDICFLWNRLSLTDHFAKDVRKGHYSGGTVTYVTLQLAYFMGFTEVVIVGLDHYFAQKGTPNQTVSANDSSHFIPDYFPAGTRWQLPDLTRSELAYATARRQFEADGRRIVDASVDGHCTVFPKVDFEEALRSP